MVTDAGFPFHTIATSKKHKQKKRKRGKKNNRREYLPRSDRRGGEKLKQEQKNKRKDPPRISERQIDKQARQTKCQDHTTVDTVRESLSTPHQSLRGGSGQSSVETRSTSIATRKITRYSSAALKSTSWELKRQSSEKFLRVAGVGLVHYQSISLSVYQSGQVRRKNVKTFSRWDDHIGCKDKTSSRHLNGFPY